MPRPRLVIFSTFSRLLHYSTLIYSTLHYSTLHYYSTHHFWSRFGTHFGHFLTLFSNFLKNSTKHVTMCFLTTVHTKIGFLMTQGHENQRKTMPDLLWNRFFFKVTFLDAFWPPFGSLWGPRGGPGHSKGTPRDCSIPNLEGPKTTP